MHPEFISLFGRTIYWYGVMMALAFLAGILLWRHLASNNGRPADYGSDLAIWVLLPGIIGARLLYVLANWTYYASLPSEIWRIDHGGLVFYGGIVGGAVGALIFAWRRSEPLVELLDFLVVALPLGHAFGRFGCFLNGCCYGAPTRLAWGVAMADNPPARHPVQLLESFGNLLIFAVLYLLYRRHPRPGRVGAIYLVLYPVLRFGLEFLRGDERLRFHGLTAAQWLSLTLIATAFPLAIHAYRRANVPICSRGRKPAS